MQPPAIIMDHPEFESHQSGHRRRADCFSSLAPLSAASSRGAMAAAAAAAASHGDSRPAGCLAGIKPHPNWREANYLRGPAANSSRLQV